MFTIVFALAACTTPEPQITMDSAIDNVLTTVGIDIKDAKNITAQANDEGDTPCYEINFSYEGQKYDCRVDANTGEVMYVTSAEENSAQAQQPSMARMMDGPPVYDTEAGNTDIGIEQAKNIAISHAGVNADEAVFTQAKQGVDDGRKIYEIEFVCAGFEYDYEIDAAGSITEAESQAVNGGKARTVTEQNTVISVKEAKSIALKYAGIAPENAVFTQAKQDIENGKEVYEIEFVAGSAEYSFEIDAQTGSITDYEKETKN